MSSASFKRLKGKVRVSPEQGGGGGTGLRFQISDDSADASVPQGGRRADSPPAESGFSDMKASPPRMLQLKDLNSDDLQRRSELADNASDGPEVEAKPKVTLANKQGRRFSIDTAYAAPEAPPPPTSNFKKLMRSASFHHSANDNSSVGSSDGAGATRNGSRAASIASFAFSRATTRGKQEAILSAGPEEVLLQGMVTCAAIVLLILVPVDLSRSSWRENPRWTASYTVGYTMDTLLLAAGSRQLGRMFRSGRTAGGPARLAKVQSSAFASEVLLLLLAAPYDAFLWPTSAAPLVPYLRVTRLFAAWPRVHKFLGALERWAPFNFLLARALRIALGTILMLHWASCLFWRLSSVAGSQHYATEKWMVSANDEDLSGWWYLRALYWAAQNLCSRDIGAIDPLARGAELWEYATGIMQTVCFELVYVYSAANLTAMMMRYFQQLESYRTNMHSVDSYLLRNNVSRKLRGLVRSHFRQVFEGSGMTDESLLRQMPFTLGREVMKEKNMRVIRRSPGFIGLDPAALRMLSASIRQVTFHPGEIICTQGDVLNELLILESGLIKHTIASEKDEDDDSDRPNDDSGSKTGLSRVDDYHSEVSAPHFGLLNRPDDGTFVQMLTSPGLMLCELSFFYGVRCEATAEATKQTTCLLLEKDSFAKMCSQFPGDGHRVRKRVLEQAQQRATNKLELSAIQKIEEGAAMPLMLLFAAAASGDEAEVREIINPSGGKPAVLDPDAVDAFGRTSLHAAAAHGHQHIVETCLELGADPKVLDQAGEGALELAVSRSHEGCCRALQKAGARLTWDKPRMAAELCECAQHGHLEQLKLMLICGADVTAADYDARTALHLAAASGQTKVVQAILQQKAVDVNVLDRWGNSPLLESVRGGHTDVTKLLLAKGAKLLIDASNASSELCERARNGDLERIRMLLLCGVDVNAADYDDRTCLHLAASVGDLATVRELVANGANVQSKDRWQNNALADAVREGHGEVAAVLIGTGATLDYPPLRASSELCDLAHEGKYEQLKMLLDGGCSVNAADYDQRACLHLASTSGNLHIVNLLCERGADVNTLDTWGNSPLSEAVRHGHANVAKALHERGAVLGFDEARASSALCDSALRGDLEKIRLCITVGIDVNAKDYDKRTCLHVAASEGDHKLVTLLLQHGARTDVKDRWGGTPLDDARRENYPKVTALLGGAGHQEPALSQRVRLAPAGDDE